MNANKTMPGVTPDQRSAAEVGMRWIVSQEGSRQTYGVPLAFEKVGCLRQFYADVWCRVGRSWLKRGPAGARALATRYNGGIPAQKVVSFNRRGLAWRAWQHFRRHQMSPEEQANLFIHYGQWFATMVRDRVAQLPLDAERDCFFGFNTNCLETLELLKAKKIFTVVDQIDPGLVEEEMVLDEAARWPGWEKIPGRLPEKYWQRLRQEWDLADAILVNSEWSQEALVRQGVAGKKIMVVPLAIDLHHEHSAPLVRATGQLKVIWLGSVILRKGIQYLIEAARLLLRENIEFILAGPMGISRKVVHTFPANVKAIGRVTRDQLSTIYQQGHVFVLPTISDGFAITQLEAMAHGLPVIATPNCGRVVTDGFDGLVVPARDGAALANALARLNADRPLITEMSRNAVETVKRYDLPSNAYLINTETQSRRLGKNRRAE
jgi:glycosyltransferase involved in cell wall biosynthesis